MSKASKTRIVPKDIPLPLSEAMAVVRLLRKLGFMISELDVEFEPLMRTVLVRVQSDDKVHQISCGSMDDWCDEEKFLELMQRLERLWTDSDPEYFISGTTKDYVYYQSQLLANGGNKRIVQDLRDLGFRFRMTVEPKGALLGGS